MKNRRCGQWWKNWIFSRRNIEKSGGFLLAKGREYWYRTPPAPNQSYYCPNCKLLLTRVDEFHTP